MRLCLAVFKLTTISTAIRTLISLLRIVGGFRMGVSYLPYAYCDIVGVDFSLGALERAISDGTNLMKDVGSYALMATIFKRYRCDEK